MPGPHIPQPISRKTHLHIVFGDEAWTAIEQQLQARLHKQVQELGECCMIHDELKQKHSFRPTICILPENSSTFPVDDE